MSLTFLTLEVANPALPGRTVAVDFPVDSGAVYSVVPEEILRDLGIQPLAEQEFRLANGETIRRK
ncbi:MAG: aspartyl protease, partial [Desulfotomaculales bacterium]